MTRHLYQLRDEMRVPGRWHLGEARTPDGVEPFLDGGVRSAATELLIEITNAGRALDFSLTSFNVPVVRASLADAVAKAAGSDVQCLPAQVGRKAGFAVLNAVRVVRCINEEGSEFLKWTAQDHRPDLAGGYRQVTKLQLDSAAVPPDAHFFRLQDWEVALVVSESVKLAMELAGCIGAKFSELSLA